MSLIFLLFLSKILSQSTFLFFDEHVSSLSYHAIVGSIIILIITLQTIYIIKLTKDKHKLRLRIKKTHLLTSSILQCTPLTVFQIDKKGRIKSPPFSTFENLNPQFRKNQTIDKLWVGEMATKIEEAIQEVISTKVVYSFETTQTTNNEVKWYDIQIVPYTKKEVLLALRDITDHHSSLAKQLESEFIFQTIFNNGSNGVGVLNEEHEWININNQLATMLGYSIDELLQLKWSNIAIPEDLEYDNYIFSKFATQSNWNYEADKRFISKSGEIIDLNCSILLFHDPLHNTKEFIITFQDIRIRKEHERALLNTVIETEEREKTNFAQEIHDGLGPILSAIKMYVQWFKKPDTKIKKDEILNDIEKLIDEAQNSTREISFKLSPHVLKNFGLSAALQSYAEKLSSATPLNFIFDIDDPKKRYTEAIEVILYRGITECINNTLKYAKATNAKITIKKHNEKELIVTFEDDGIGFNAQKILSSAKGSGLYNIQNRLKSINGECLFLGTEGVGTKIQFKLNI